MLRERVAQQGARSQGLQASQRLAKGRRMRGAERIAGELGAFGFRQVPQAYDQGREGCWPH